MQAPCHDLEGDPYLLTFMHPHSGLSPFLTPPHHSFFGEGKDKILGKLVFSKETSVDGILRTSFGIF